MNSSRFDSRAVDFRTKYFVFASNIKLNFSRGQAVALDFLRKIHPAATWTSLSFRGAFWVAMGSLKLLFSGAKFGHPPVPFSFPFPSPPLSLHRGSLVSWGQGQRGKTGSTTKSRTRAKPGPGTTGTTRDTAGTINRAHTKARDSRNKGQGQRGTPRGTSNRVHTRPEPGPGTTRDTSGDTKSGQHVTKARAGTTGTKARDRGGTRNRPHTLRSSLTIRQDPISFACLGEEGDRLHKNQSSNPTKRLQQLLPETQHAPATLPDSAITPAGATERSCKALGRCKDCCLAHTDPLSVSLPIYPAVPGQIRYQDRSRAGFVTLNRHHSSFRARFWGVEWIRYQDRAGAGFGTLNRCQDCYGAGFETLKEWTWAPGNQDPPPTKKKSRQISFEELDEGRQTVAISAQVLLPLHASCEFTFVRMDSKQDEAGYSNKSVAPAVNGTQLSIKFLSGEVAWGPSKADLAQQQVGDLCEAVAKKQGVHRQAVILVAGEKELSTSRTLLEEGVSGPDAQLKAMILPFFEMAKRMLADKFNPDIERDLGEVGAYGVQRVPAVSPLSDTESQAFIASLSAACGCAESGFSEEVAGWLKAICACKRVSGPSVQFNRENLDQELAFKTCRPGLLALDIARFRSEDDIMVYLIDLKGELAKLFGEDPKRGEGVVWLYNIECEFLRHINEAFNTQGLEYSLPHLQKVVKHRTLNPSAPLQAKWLPHTVASALTVFFARWDAEGKMPCDATADLPGVKQFFDNIEKAAQQKLTDKLQAVADLLSKREMTTLISEADLRPLAELMGWIPTPVSHPENLWPLVEDRPVSAWPSLQPGAITAAWHDQFEKICIRDWTEYGLPEIKLSTSETGLPTDAFISFVQYDNPLLDPARFDYVEVGTEEKSDEVLGALRQGPLSLRGRYLSKDDQDFVASKALAKSLFKMLDKDADGFLSCEELQPVAEMLWAKVGDPESPDQELVLTPFHPDMFADGSPGMPGTQMPSESEMLERWQSQYANMCKCWEPDVAGQLSESGFTKSIMKSKWWVNPVASALMWVLQCLEAGPPTGGHYMQIEQYANINQRSGNFDEAGQFHEVPPPDCSGQDAYTLACLGGGVARTVQWTDPDGDIYSILVHPSRHNIAEDKGDKYIPGLYSGAPASTYE